ncbi:MAG: hypothetical protein N3F07_03120 [Candidatus Micrarchaeota archaeon]|nr:hypothetical protein [Candidatus Micrarchaeota archaeon]
MTYPKNRSSSMRKIFKRTPKGGRVVHYKRAEKGDSHYDPVSNERLQAVSSKRGLPKSMRRPNRKFGGQLTSKNSSLVLKTALRVREGFMKLEEVDLRILPYVKRLLLKK